ncbi:nucleoside phosphorylase domain-containing protein [Aspergillus carlsbadensis]|nr:nucleoside phosphorylase domain-containing protein [Aspergillus carlsbadensis]
MAHPRQPRDAAQFQIAFFCALAAERHAITLALDEQYETSGILYPRHSSDPNTYTTGRIGSHYVVIVYLAGAGNMQSAGAATRLTMTFPGIKLAIAVGVCGVNPRARDADGQEVLLGDVIVSTAIVPSRYGARYDEGDEDAVLIPPVAIRTFLKKLKVITVLQRMKRRMITYTEAILDGGLRPRGVYPGPENDVLYDAGYQHKHRKPNGGEICADCQRSSYAGCPSAWETPCAILGCDAASQLPRSRLRVASGLHPDRRPIRERDNVERARRPSILFGKFASSNSVMASAYHRDQLIQQRGVLGFERVGEGSWEYIPTIIVKGASDYADSHRNEVWQHYAAITAAACAKAIVEEWRFELTPGRAAGM